MWRNTTLIKGIQELLGNKRWGARVGLGGTVNQTSEKHSEPQYPYTQSWVPLAVSGACDKIRETRLHTEVTRKALLPPNRNMNPAMAMMMIYLTGWEMPRWFNKAQPRLRFRDSQIVRVLICGRVCLLGSRILEWDGRAAGDGPLGQCPPVELHLILPVMASLSSSHPGSQLCFLGTMMSHLMLLPHQRAKLDSKD